MSLWRNSNCLAVASKRVSRSRRLPEKAVGELKTVIGLNTLDGNAFAGKMLDDFA